MTCKIEFAIHLSDITKFESDITIVKHAQAFYGADKTIAERLVQSKITELDDLRIEVGEYKLVETEGCIGSRNVLFIGVPELELLRFSHIRKFSREALEILSKEKLEIRHLSMTIHGVRFGLDEAATFLAQFAGVLEAMRKGDVPSTLAGVSIVERDPERVQRLRNVLEQRLIGEPYASRTTTGAAYYLTFD